MASKGFRVTVEDLDTGETESKVVAPGDYLLITIAPCRLSSVSQYPKSGTVQLTLKGYQPPSYRPQQTEVDDA
ncbi:hypothetical protein BAY59_10890 [Prauserella coralliicola]|nr:hypothetical protein BAY59_10890 [Prauserella coralliicola]